MKHTTLEARAAAQGLVPAPGQTLLTYRDALTHERALQALGARGLPKGGASSVSAHRRALKPFLDDFAEEQNQITLRHTPVLPPGTALPEGAAVEYVDPLGMMAERTALEWMVFAVTLPPPLTAANLPKNDKAHPNAEDGLENLKHELGPLYAEDDA